MRSIGGETHGAVLRLIIAELALLIVGLWAVSFCCSSHIQEAMDIFARSQVMTVSRLEAVGSYLLLSGHGPSGQGSSATAWVEVSNEA